jgi:deoxycytidylate deaminase
MVYRATLNSARVPTESAACGTRARVSHTATCNRVSQCVHAEQHVCMQRSAAPKQLQSST